MFPLPRRRPDPWARLGRWGGERSQRGGCSIRWSSRSADVSDDPRLAGDDRRGVGLEVRIEVLGEGP